MSCIYFGLFVYQFLFWTAVNCTRELRRPPGRISDRFDLCHKYILYLYLYLYFALCVHNAQTLV
jgi:hypothetical protein